MYEKKDVKAQVQTAMILHKQGKLNEAKIIYEDVIALDPKHFTALQLLGLVSYQLGEFERAIALLLQAIEVNDRLAFVHQNLGNAFEQLDRLDSALASYDRAIALEPAYTAAYNDRGNVLKKVNRLDDAIASYRKAIALKDDYAEAYNNLGVALNGLKRHVEALANFEKAIRLKPDFSQAYHNQDIAFADLAQWNLLVRYKATFGVLPRLHPPISFNEHILHRIIYDRDPKLKIVCDKIAVRRMIEERAGVEYVVPLLGIWEHAKEITWEKLPQKFVLKPSHSSGPFAIVDQSTEINKEEIMAMADQWVSYDFFVRSLEWGYRGLPRRILAEPFLCASNGDAASEIHVHTFSGKAALICVLVGAKHTSDRRQWWLDVTGRQVAIRKTRAEFQLSDDDRKKMVEIAERTSQDFSSLRVDFFMTSSGLKINELTPYTLGGVNRWDPPELDEKLGKLWEPGFDLSTIPDFEQV